MGWFSACSGCGNPGLAFRTLLRQDEIYDRIVRKYVSCAYEYSKSVSTPAKKVASAFSFGVCARFCRSQKDWQPLIEAMCLRELGFLWDRVAGR